MLRLVVAGRCTKAVTPHAGCKFLFGISPILLIGWICYTAADSPEEELAKRKRARAVTSMGGHEE